MVAAEQRGPNVEKLKSSNETYRLEYAASPPNRSIHLWHLASEHTTSPALRLNVAPTAIKSEKKIDTQALRSFAIFIGEIRLILRRGKKSIAASAQEIINPDTFTDKDRSKFPDV
ncbi:MAG: hypothetical protein O9309_13630 [Rhizobium sp.]|nr:hypothetical protein [Rhizobium sp.]MCZ8350097.1 hypothetical protein [Rhizobium sp.]